MGIQHIYPAGHSPYLFGNEHSLVEVVCRLHQPHGCARKAVCMQNPGPARVLFNNGQSRLQNLRGRAVIHLKAYLLQAGYVCPQTRKTAAACAAEAINSLVRVTNDKQGAARPVPCANQLILRVVDIRTFIHKQMGKTAPACHIQLQRLGQQVVKVQCAQLIQPVLICLV